VTACHVYSGKKYPRKTHTLEAPHHSDIVVSGGRKWELHHIII